MLRPPSVAELKAKSQGVPGYDDAHCQSPATMYNTYAAVAQAEKNARPWLVATPASTRALSGHLLGAHESRSAGELAGAPQPSATSRRWREEVARTGSRICLRAFDVARARVAVAGAQGRAPWQLPRSRSSAQPRPPVPEIA